LITEALLAVTSTTQAFEFAVRVALIAPNTENNVAQTRLSR
jgi:hypothetical protein